MKAMWKYSAVLMAMMLSSSGLDAQSATTTPQEVTFTKDVAPILQRSCQSCHRPDNIAPMPLLTYEQARPWAKSIKEKVLLRIMPPWYIDPNVGIRKFKNDGGLSDQEIATIVKWVDAGAPRGNPADLPPPLVFDDSKWKIGEPDLIVQMLPKDLEIAGSGPDQWRNFLADRVRGFGGSHQGRRESPLRCNRSVAAPRRRGRLAGS